MYTSIWLKDPTILLKHNQLKNIWPVASMTATEKVNAVSRLIILLTIVGYLLTLSPKIFYIGFVTLAIISLLYFIQPTKYIKKRHEGFSTQLSGVYPSLTNPLTYEANEEAYVKPTENNPLMNVLIPEIYYDPKRKPAAPSFNPTVEKEINRSVQDFVGKKFHDKNIDKKLFHDLGDQMEFNRSMLPWTATANTQVPNDVKAYRDYLYGDMISGKEGNPFALERTSSGAYNYQLAP